MYVYMSTAIVYGVTEYAPTLTLLNHVVKFPGAINSNIGIYSWTSYQIRAFHTETLDTPTRITSMDEVYFNPAGDASFSIDPSTDLISSVPTNAQYTLTLNDGVCFFQTVNPIGGVSDVPTTYFAVSVTDPGPTSTKTFKLAATASGSPIDITSAGTPTYMGFRFQNYPVAGTGLDVVGNNSYTTTARACFRMAEAVGATMPGSLRTDMDTIWNRGAPSLAAFPLWAFATSY
jgi:hypothetical protein